MKRYAKKPITWIQVVGEFISRPVVLVLLFALTFTLIGLGQARTNHTSQQQAHLAQQQSQLAQQQARQAKDQLNRLQFGLCGLQVYLATPSPPQQTQSSTTFRDVLKNLTGEQSLNCSPDPNDGK